MKSTSNYKKSKSLVSMLISVNTSTKLTNLERKYRNAKKKYNHLIIDKKCSNNPSLLTNN